MWKGLCKPRIWPQTIFANSIPPVTWDYSLFPQNGINEPITLSFLMPFLLPRMPDFPSPYCPLFLKLHTHHHYHHHIYSSFKAQLKLFLLCKIFLTILLKFIPPSSPSSQQFVLLLAWTPFSLVCWLFAYSSTSPLAGKYLWGLFTLVSHPSPTPLPTPPPQPYLHHTMPSTKFVVSHCLLSKWMALSSFPWYHGRLRTNLGPCVAKSSCFHDPCPPHSQFHTHTLALVLFSILILSVAQRPKITSLTWLLDYTHTLAK